MAYIEVKKSASTSSCTTPINLLFSNFPLALRQKRLGHDLRGLLSDASEGIRAKPLDSSYYHW